LKSTNEPIRSLQNPQVKEWAALQTKKGRDRADAYLIEGAHLVTEALTHGADVTNVMFVPGSSAAAEAERACAAIDDGRVGAVPWIPVAEQVMAKITDAETPQGVAAVVRKRTASLEALFDGRPLASFVAVDAVQDPGNLGTIVRSADAAGASAVLVGIGSADPYNPKTIRATMGSLFHIPIVLCDLRAALPAARARGINVVATSLEARRSCYEASLGGPVCFLLGNEGAGVSPDLQALADETVIIPMRGAAESLNVAMAGTILLFEALRQREFGGRANR